MPEKQTIERAHRAKREGKSPSTQAGEFIREEIHHIRKGKHGARSTKQVIAIGLSKARRAGVNLKPPPKGKVSVVAHRRAKSDYRAGQLGLSTKPTPKRSRATLQALRHESRRAALLRALAQQPASVRTEEALWHGQHQPRRGAKTRAAGR